DEQAGALAEHSAHRLDERTEAMSANRQRRGDGFDDEVTVCQRRELDQPDDLEFGREPPGDLQGQTGLADATWPGQRYQALLAHECFEIGHILVSADEAAQ